MLTGFLFVCPAGVSEQHEVEEKWRKVKKTSGSVSASHVSLISVKLSALEQSPSGALDDGSHRIWQHKLTPRIKSNKQIG